MQSTKDIGEIIADFVRKTYTDTDSRFEYQAEALLEKQCTNAAVGKVFELANVEYLLSAFDLEDEDFAEEFPAMSYLNRSERQLLLTTMQQHLESCSRCGLKQAYDLEFETRLRNACRQNSDALLQVLKDDEITDDCEPELATAGI